MRIPFQLNLFSLTGYYGQMPKKKAEWLLQNGMYDLCGTDIHSVEYLDETMRQKVKRIKSTLLNIITQTSN